MGSGSSGVLKKERRRGGGGVAGSGRKPDRKKAGRRIAKKAGRRTAKKAGSFLGRRVLPGFGEICFGEIWKS